MAIKKRVAKKKVAKKKAIAKRRISKKKVVRKKVSRRVGTSTTARSMATKKKPSARLQKRRARNTRKGYYPNPDNRRAYVVMLRDKTTNKLGYYSGEGFDDDITQAVIYRTVGAAKNAAKNLPVTANIRRKFDIGYASAGCGELMGN